MSAILTSAQGYADSEASGFVEPLDAWSARTQIPDDWQERLALAWCWSLVVTAMHAAQLEARIAAERGVTDRLVTFVTSGLTGRHIAKDIAISCALLLLGHRLTHWGTRHA